MRTLDAIEIDMVNTADAINLRAMNGANKHNMDQMQKHVNELSALIVEASEIVQPGR